jgi:hypothetical protein
MRRPGSTVLDGARAREILALGALLLLAPTACSEGTRPEPGVPIEPAGGAVAAFGDSVRLVAPPGAVSATVRVTIVRVADPPAGSGLVPGSVVDIGPDSTTLLLPMTLEVRYDASAVPAGATEADLRLHIRDGTVWRELPGGSSRDGGSHRIAGQITRFGRYGVMPAGAASVQLSDTAVGPITSLAGRTLVARAFDVAGAPLAGASFTLAALDPTVANVETGLAVRGASTGAARFVLASGLARDTLVIDAVFGWRAIRFVGGGNAPYHACGIGQDDRVFCWGENKLLQGGRATPDSALAPVAVPGVAAAGAAARLAAGSGATCYAPGGAWTCWGTRRMSGEDVIGATTPRDAPWLADGRMHLGFNGGCVTPSDGTARCWGVSPGDGSNPSSIRWTPQDVQQPGGPWMIVRPGLNVVCGLTTQGRAYCWGPNVHGSNGTGLPPGQFQENVPNAVATTQQFDDVRVGPDFACGLTVEGDVWCWGKNRGGVMGDTTAIPESPIPVRAPIGALRFHANGTGETFGVGSLHACGLTSGGQAYCWGRGAEGALGSGSTAYAPAPVAVAGGHRFRALTVGALFTCGITPYGAGYCWGLNDYGALGIPSVPLFAPQLTPAVLVAP